MEKKNQSIYCQIGDGTNCGKCAGSKHKIKTIFQDFLHYRLEANIITREKKKEQKGVISPQTLEKNAGEKKLLGGGAILRIADISSSLGYAAVIATTTTTLRWCLN